VAKSLPATQLHVHLLGQPRFALGDEPFRFSARPKALPLLGYLLLHRDRPVSRDSLAFLLWEDDEEEKARTNLRRHLHELGQLLPTAPVPWFVTDSETVAWNATAPLWLDVAEFEAHIARGEPSGAVDLYGGDLLENLYEEWLFGPRDRFRNAYLAALTDLIRAARGARNFTAAAEYAGRLLRGDPWREDIVRQLMAVRYESGDRAGALQTFDSFARLLRAEMDVEPMPETIALRDVIVRNAATEPAAGEVSPERQALQVNAPATFMLPFVGRDSELEQLAAAWSRAARGRGGALLVSGEAGIGKTRLVSQLAMRAEAEGGRVLWGATSSPESVAYQSLADALRNAVPMIAASTLRPLWLASLAQIVPELRSRVPDLPDLPPIDPQRERTRLFEAIATTLEALSTPRPLLLVLEDLHWAEAATIAALEFLVARVTQRSILVIGTYRDEEVARVHALRNLRRRLQPERLLAHIALPPLGREAVNDLVETLPSRRGSSRDVVDDVYAISEGNPLFVGEVIRNLAEGWELDVTSSTLHDLIGARFERLSTPARELAEIAATIGEGFDVDVLREASAWSEPAVLEALDELQDRAIIREPVGRHRFDYAFTHHLVQRTVYLSSSPKVRQRRHRRIARVMEDLFAPRLEVVAAEVARHHEGGGNLARAGELYVHAARAAAAVFANDEALAHARKAVTLCGEDSAIRFEALALAEAMNDRAGDREAQRADLAALEALTRASANRAQLCDILSRSARFHRARGDRVAEHRAIEELKAEAQATGNAHWLGEAFEAEATYLEVTGKPAEALPVVRKAVEYFGDAGNARGLVSALTLQASVAAFLGETAEADACISRAREVAHAAREATLLVRVLRCETNVCHWFERWQRHDEVARESFALARSVGDREMEATCLGALALSETRLNRFREAREHFVESAALFESIGKLQGWATVSINASAIEIEAGRWAPAMALSERAELLAQRCDWRYGEGLCLVNRGLVAHYRGDFLAARAYAEKALALAAQLGNERLEAVALAQRGGALFGLGDGAGAVRELVRACAFFERSNGTEPLADAKSDLAQACWSIGEVDRALAVALEIVRDVEGAATLTRVAPARTLWGAALVLHWAGDQSASGIVRRCHQLLVERRDSYEDEESREAYMRIPVYEQIVAAHERDEWPIRP